MKEIPLNRGMAALVDDADFLELSKIKWSIKKGCNTYYAQHTSYGPLKSTTTLMHRIIMKTPAGMDTDHINGNGLDNRRVNLRIVTHKENMQNESCYRLGIPRKPKSYIPAIVPNKKYLKVSEYASKKQVTVRVIRAEIKKGRIKAERIGKEYRIPVGE